MDSKKFNESRKKLISITARAQHQKSNLQSQTERKCRKDCHHPVLADPSASGLTKITNHNLYQLKLYHPRHAGRKLGVSPYC